MSILLKNIKHIQSINLYLIKVLFNYLDFGKEENEGRRFIQKGAKTRDSFKLKGNINLKRQKMESIRHLSKDNEDGYIEVMVGYRVSTKN
jgi:hypothetical protein